VALPLKGEKNMDIKKIQEQMVADTAYFKQLFETLDEKGCFNDRLPNTAPDYNRDAEFADLLRYSETIHSPDSLSFWRS